MASAIKVVMFNKPTTYFGNIGLHLHFMINCQKHPNVLFCLNVQGIDVGAFAGAQSFGKTMALADATYL